MQSIYSWIVFVHVLAAFGFALAHGTAALAAFRIRAEREPTRIAALLDLSNASTSFMYVSLFVVVASGVGAGLMGHWFSQLWIWAAIIVLAGVWVAMLVYAAPYYQRVRHAVGQPGWRARVESEPASPAELASLLDSRRPEGIAIIGGVGLALIVYLMIFKPF